jgi:hypothetical protein
MGQAIIAANATTTTSRLIDSGRVATGMPAVMRIIITGIVPLTVAATADMDRGTGTAIEARNSCRCLAS